MKYLGLHKLIWAIIVIALTSFECVIILFIYLLYVIWNLQLPSNVWEHLHTSNGTYCHPPYYDKNVWQTIKRRYNCVFDE